MDIVCPEQTVLMESRTFVAGDLSFYGTVLGKENMQVHGVHGVCSQKESGA
jgi:hypothetical protein